MKFYTIEKQQCGTTIELFEHVQGHNALEAIDSIATGKEWGYIFWIAREEK